jgi:putative flippase GtrA
VAGFRAIARQVSTFGAVSVATTILDFALFNVLILTESIPVVAANTISYSTGIVASYLLNKRFTFTGGGRDKRSHEVALFLLFNILGLGLNNLAVGLVADVRSTLLLNVMKLLAGVVAAIVKFVGFKRWVYPIVVAPTDEDGAPV